MDALTLQTKRDPGHRQVVVVGSGFGGALAAWPLVRAGFDVLMLERGPWVPRGPHNWLPDGTITRTRFYEEDGFGPALTDAGPRSARSAACVGGPSVFYGGVSMRFREADFLPDPEIVGDSGAEWPFRYDELRPWYDEAERILSVAGVAGDDPTDPPRGPYPARPNDLSKVSSAIADAARSLGLHPFRLPLAINFAGNGNGLHPEEDDGTSVRQPCQECTTCDTFACAVGAKNDLASTVLALLQRRGMEIRSETGVTRLHVERGPRGSGRTGAAAAGVRITGVECVDLRTRATYTVTADRVILAAGALGTPRLLLASGLGELSPAGDVVGRYLTRHTSGIVFGTYPWIPRYEGHFHKQIGINDFYLGDPDGKGPKGKLGNIQQTQTPNLGTVVGETGAALGALLAPFVRRATGLLVMAEDRPSYGNRVYLEDAESPSGPRALIEHHYHDRDVAARRRLYARARRIHRAAGALLTYTHSIHTFSHALGTVRMGPDPLRAPLDGACRFRGVENLLVTDGSALPRSGGVNPSLTIAANALRAGSILVEELRAGGTAP